MSSCLDGMNRIFAQNPNSDETRMTLLGKLNFTVILLDVEMEKLIEEAGSTVMMLVQDVPDIENYSSFRMSSSKMYARFLKLEKSIDCIFNDL